MDPDDDCEWCRKTLWECNCDPWQDSVPLSPEEEALILEPLETVPDEEINIPPADSRHTSQTGH